MGSPTFKPCFARPASTSDALRPSELEMIIYHRELITTNWLFSNKRASHPSPIETINNLKPHLQSEMGQP